MSRYIKDTKRSRYQRAEEPPKSPVKLILVFILIALVAVIKFFPFTAVFPSLKGVLNETPDYGLMFLEIKNVVKSHIFLPPTADFVNPLSGAVTSPFGERTDPVTGESGFHSGIDIDAPENSSVIASASGEVIEVGEDEQRGKYIIIKVNNEITTMYQHLNDIYKIKGDKVNQGDEIAISGNTGKTTSPHLHFEILVNNEPKNPADYIK
ncbi:MAG: M23 family metallopeptidase [Clostridia bacterium]|nr:M23 family metallopeptidase [Clostridia bacterium]